ncbi:TetR/AcrR family transcriptional regulator [Bacillus sp. FJAT-42315]|uniref:TetR/AcrR family transcriptional regulator n=1 Tax=Bacillus sp. FJAT-42315 TaxID=2014077 RepID=UPI000C24E01E|nr:TetR/AcrR family transcriptional regulator [Bacillus sp. FJAT-42315]
MSEASHNVDRREQILQISLQLFASRGYHKTKISDIVSGVGVAQGTFYWYFKSKEAIALEIIHKGTQSLLEVVSKGYRQSPGTVQDTVKASERLFENLFLFSQDNKFFMEILLRGMESEASIHEAIMETRLQIEEAFKKNIERAIEFGILPNNDPSIQSALLVSLLEGILSKWLFGPITTHSKLHQKTANELAKEVVRFEFFGLLGI